MKWHKHYDVRGKSLDEIMVIVETSMREFLDGKLTDNEDMLRSRGATQAELDSYQSSYREQTESWLSEHLKEQRAWLLRGGEDLH